MHPIFYILLLEKAPQNAKQQRLEIEDKNKYKVE
jgi:hypothetical protein